MHNGITGYWINQLISNALGTQQYNFNQIKNIHKSTPYMTTLTCVRTEKEVEQNVGEDVNLGSADKHADNFVNEVQIEPSININENHR